MLSEVIDRRRSIFARCEIACCKYWGAEVEHMVDLLPIGKTWRRNFVCF